MDNSTLCYCILNLQKLLHHVPWSGGVLNSTSIIYVSCSFYEFAAHSVNWVTMIVQLMYRLYYT